jgi:hypothetical protein
MQVYKDEFLGRKNNPPDDELLLEKTNDKN